MKKIFLLFLLGSLFASCSKEPVNDAINTNENSRTENTNILAFASIEDYAQLFKDEQQLQTKLQNSNFTSLESKITAYNDALENEKTTTGLLKNVTDLDYEDFGILPKILNEDRIVKIGKHYIKVDLPLERVLVLDETYFNEYNDLLADNIGNEHIMIYDTGEEVLNLLAKNESSSVFRGCKDRRAHEKVAEDEFYNGRRHRVKCKAKYQRGGIYFSLMTKAKPQKRRLRIWWSDGGSSVGIGYKCEYEVRCGKYYHEDSWVYGTGYTQKRFYEGFVGLKNYRLNTRFNTASGSGYLEDISDY